MENEKTLEQSAPETKQTTTSENLKVETRNNNNDFESLVSVITGICSLCTIGVNPYISLIVAIVGLIFGIQSVRKSKSPMGTAGLISSLLTIILVAVVLLLTSFGIFNFLMK